MEAQWLAGRHDTAEIVESATYKWAGRRKSKSHWAWLEFLKAQSPPPVMHKTIPTLTSPHILILSNNTTTCESVGAIFIQTVIKGTPLGLRFLSYAWLFLLLVGFRVLSKLLGLSVSVLKRLMIPLPTQLTKNFELLSSYLVRELQFLFLPY